MFRFMYPSQFLWWLGLFGLVLLYGLYRRQVKNRLQSVFGARIQNFFTQSFSVVKIRWKFTLCLASMALMVVALARPQMGKGNVEITSEGVEVMVAIDVSQSMLAEDVKPSRLDHARKEVETLLSQMGGHKVGLLAFAGDTNLLSPLTTDMSAVGMFLDTLSPESVLTQGTELKAALGVAQDSFKRGGEEDGGPDQKVTRVIILISDGESHSDGAASFAKQLADQGTRVFTMAFGTERGAKIPRRDGRGVLRGYLKNSSQQEVVSKVNGETLKKIARSGKGSFYHVTFGGDHMKRLLDDINRLEKSEFDSLSAESFSEKYQWPLAFALILALIELMLSTKNTRAREWKGRFIGESS